MGYAASVALRYIGSKKRNMISISTALAVGGVTLGVAALTIVLSVTGGFLDQFREKILGVNADVLVLKYSIDFREYRDVMDKIKDVPGVVATEPFVINPMMVTHGDRTATGVLLKGVDPQLMPRVLDLPKHIVAGSLEGLRRPDAKPPQRQLQPARGGSGLDYGAPLPDADAGTDTFLDWMRREVDEEMRRGDGGIATPGGNSRNEARTVAAPEPSLDFHAGPGMVVGEVTPSGGYKSRLPEDDDIPDAIDPDPCKNALQVSEMPGIVIGRSLARQLAVGLGECIQVTSPQIGTSFGAGSRPPIAKRFRVIAIFEAGFDQYDSKLVYADLYEAQAFYEYGDSVTGVEMKVRDINRAHQISTKIERLLNNGIYHTMDWRELNHGLFTALFLQQILMSAVLGLIILVAACSVIATIIMVVLEKKKEIALLKALGARDGAILRIFLYHGGFIGLLGAAMGASLGAVACRLLVEYKFPLDPKVYFISGLPVSVRPIWFALPPVAAMVICLAATVFPALYAARLRPAEGLRAE